MPKDKMVITPTAGQSRAEKVNWLQISPASRLKNKPAMMVEIHSPQTSHRFIMPRIITRFHRLAIERHAVVIKFVVLFLYGNK